MPDEAPSIRIRREHSVYQNEYGELFDDEVQFWPSGKHGRYVRWNWHAPYSVAVLPLLDEATAVLVRIFRHSARKPILEVPKGFGDVDRDPENVARAELAEETGLAPRDVKAVGFVTVDPAFSFFPMHLFIASGCQAAGPAHPEASEAILAIVEVDLRCVPSLLRDGEVIDATTLVLLWHAYDRLAR